MHTTNYYSTFIAVAEDCPVKKAEIPPGKVTGKTVANLHFDLIYENPYALTSDEVLFKTFAEKNKLAGNELAAAREHFFSKGQACLRASPLTKRYGWGIHFNAEGKTALYELGSEEYDKLLKDNSLKQVKAIRSKKAEK